jgi:hypothetical protein
MLARAMSCFSQKHSKLQWCAPGYKKYSDYNKIYCLDSQNCLLAVRALGKDKIRFMMPQYNYSEIMSLSLETALDNLENLGGKVLLEEIELQMNRWSSE